MKRWLATSLVLLPLGCGGGGGGSVGDDGGAPDAGADAGPCLSTHVDRSTGRVVDPDGAAIEGATVGFCLRAGATSLCLQPVPTAADGTYSVDVPAQFQCLDHAVDRIVGDGYSVGYCVLDLDGIDGLLAAPDFALFPLEGPEPAWGPGEDDEITYVADDGAEVTLRPSDVVGGDVEAELRMTFVDSTGARPCFLPEDQTLATFYAMGPEALSMREGGLPATLVDHTGLPAGTVVDLYMLGSLLTGVGEGAVVEGSWEAFAQSTVAADGTIPTPAGQGLRQLGWVGAVAR